MSGVLDVVKQGGQYQVVVGPSVEKKFTMLLSKMAILQRTRVIAQ